MLRSFIEEILEEIDEKNGLNWEKEFESAITKEINSAQLSLVKQHKWINNYSDMSSFITSPLLRAKETGATKGFFTVRENETVIRKNYEWYYYINEVSNILSPLQVEDFLSNRT